MRNSFLSGCVVAAFLALVSVPSFSQEIVHALTGTVSSINSAAKTVTVFQDSGSTGTYQEWTKSKSRVAFDKRIEAETTAAGSFDKQGAYVIVFYIGGDGDRTAVAFKNLGTGPFQSAEGKVTHYDSHSHEISIQDESGKEQTFKIETGTIAETGMGAVPGQRFEANRGDKVRIVSSKGDSVPTALFVRDL